MKLMVVIAGWVWGTSPLLAQDPRTYPAKPVRWVTVSAGSQGDALSRVVTAKLAELWKLGRQAGLMVK